MHPRLNEVLRYVDERRAELEAAALRLPYDRWTEPPAPEAWSLAQLFDHLYLSESGTARLLAKRIARAKEAGLGPERSTESVMQSLNFFPVVDGPPRRAPDITLPRSDVRAPEIHDALRQSRADLRAALLEGDGLALGDVTAPHPGLGVINAYQWALFIGQHEERHTRQASEIVRRLTSR